MIAHGNLCHMRSLVLVVALSALVVAGCDADTPVPAPTSAATGAPSVVPTVAGTPIPTGIASPSPNSSAIPRPTLTPPAGTPTPAGQAIEAVARGALAQWLGPVGDPASIRAVSVEPVAWPDGCLGLGRPGRACTSAIVPGYRVMLALGTATYEVRTDEPGRVVLWAPETQILARFSEAGTNYSRFTTDDGGTIEAQPVSGTDFGVPLATLAKGTPVGLGLARAPQREGLLLVWVYPAGAP